MSARAVLTVCGVVVVGVGAAWAAGPRAKDAPTQPTLAPTPSAARAAGSGATPGTACGACHVTQDWRQVKFDHAKTGFPLVGRHQAVGCKRCHPATFETPVPRSCGGCHDDPHAGELGFGCQGCHDERQWRSRFDADAHRRTGFPLVGAHGALACEECHERGAGNRFARNATACVDCHRRDLVRTVGTATDHQRLGYSERCEGCHQAWRFAPARFPEHDRCYVISSGPHASVACATCHTTVPTVLAFGACDTRTAACTSCHQHECGKSDPLHQKAAVLGYQCRDRKCYECHRELRAP